MPSLARTDKFTDLPENQPLAHDSYEFYSLKASKEYDNFPFLSFEDLQALADTEKDSSYLDEKLEKLFSSIIQKELPPGVLDLKYSKEFKSNYIRVAQWNVERGFNLDIIKDIFLDREKYLDNDVKEKYKEKSKRSRKLNDEITLLRTVDILILNEADLAHSRTAYANIPNEFAELMNAAYVFAPEFLELDPATIKDPDIDPNRYKGLHGNSIISKYPIKSAHIFELPLCYDWYEDEKKKITLLESSKRVTAKATVAEDIFTELRKGQRMSLIADITLPNGQDITIVNTHIENRTVPKCRTKQVEALLEHIKDNKNPLILAGDFNPFEFDARPTSIPRVIKSKLTDINFLAKQAITWSNPYGFIINASSTGVSVLRKYRNPTVKNVPIISPNKAYGIFDAIEDFEFSDSMQFDNEGEKKRAYKRHAGEWSASNQRWRKGFEPTFQFQRAFKLALFKTDWFFVKPIVEQVEPAETTAKKANKKEIQHYYPAFGRTLRDLNFSYKDDRISDHSPIVVDIIF